MNKKPKLLTASQVEQLFDILSEHVTPRCELDHRNVLDLLIAVVLSAQTTDKQVNVVTEELWKSLNEDNKVSLFVRYIDIETGKYETRIKNKNK